MSIKSIGILLILKFTRTLFKKKVDHYLISRHLISGSDNCSTVLVAVPREYMEDKSKKPATNTFIYPIQLKHTKQLKNRYCECLFLFQRMFETGKISHWYTVPSIRADRFVWNVLCYTFHIEFLEELRRKIPPVAKIGWRSHRKCDRLLFSNLRTWPDFFKWKKKQFWNAFLVTPTLSDFGES